MVGRRKVREKEKWLKEGRERKQEIVGRRKQQGREMANRAKRERKRKGCYKEKK